MQSADVYTCIAANLQPTEQWVLRQVCAAWRHHFRKQPPQLCLVITRRWTLKACPTSLLPQVSQLQATLFALIAACTTQHALCLVSDMLLPRCMVLSYALRCQGVAAGVQQNQGQPARARPNRQLRLPPAPGLQPVRALCRPATGSAAADRSCDSPGQVSSLCAALLLTKELMQVPQSRSRQRCLSMYVRAWPQRPALRHGPGPARLCAHGTRQPAAAGSELRCRACYPGRAGPGHVSPHRSHLCAPSALTLFGWRWLLHSCNGTTWRRAVTGLQLANIRARNVPDAEHAIMRTSLQKLTLSSLDTTNQACHGRVRCMSCTA